MSPLHSLAGFHTIQGPVLLIKLRGCLITTVFYFLQLRQQLITDCVPCLFFRFVTVIEDAFHASSSGLSQLQRMRSKPFLQVCPSSRGCVPSL
ncbi:hypothetical protein XELAEV_18002307mg [Xenopus laevis]|nr:hypothetical protein XELAEV_18002307mg [Xenopus laevis]